MAIVNVSINDTIQSWVNDTNNLARDVGDLNLLTTAVDSDIVGALNSLQSSVGQVSTLQAAIDSNDSNFIGRARSAISVTDAGGDGSLSYNDSDGIITYTGPSAAEVRAHFSAGEGIDIASGVISGEDASTTNKGIASFNSTRFSVSSGAVDVATGGIDTTQLANDAVDQTKLANVQTLVIYDSTGAAVKTLYAAGS